MKNWMLKTIGFIHGGILMTSICMNAILALVIALLCEDNKKAKERTSWTTKYGDYYSKKK